MKYSTIVCFDDLFRRDFWTAKAFFYDLIREPILQATGIECKESPRDGRQSNLLPGFDENTFKNLCGHKDWNTLYHGIPDVAQSYLESFFINDSLVISYEMPKWLHTFLISRGIDFIDIRISPLRFGRDLYISLNSNNRQLQQKIQQKEIHENHIRLEASLVKASVRHLRRYPPPDDSLEGALIYIGQTESDVSILSEDGSFLRAHDFKTRLQELFKKFRKIYYQPHPAAGDFSEREMSSIQGFYPNEIKILKIPTYELLCEEKSVEIVGISSGVLQEADFFGIPSHILYRPACPVKGPDRYIQLNFIDFISPRFWAYLLDAPVADWNDSPISYNPIPANHLRQLHDAWWGYSAYLLKDRNLSRDMVRYGVNPLPAPISSMSSSLDHLNAEFTRWVAHNSMRLDDQSAHFDAQLATLHHSLARLENVLHERDRHITALLQSSSWKLTAPMRGAARMLRNLVDRGKGR